MAKRKYQAMTETKRVRRKRLAQKTSLLGDVVCSVMSADYPAGPIPNQTNSLPTRLEAWFSPMIPYEGYYLGR